MAELVFWTIAALTIMSAAFVVLNNQLIYSAVALLFTLFGVRLIDSFGRKFLMYIGSLGYIISLISIGSCFSEKT